MKIIKLSNSARVTLVDDSDFPFLSEYRWHLHTRKKKNRTYRYARTCFYVNGKRLKVPMARIILNAPAEFDVDHNDGDGLRNLKSNLRLATRANNTQNARKPIRPATSAFKGVQAVGNKWRARIFVQSKRRHLGIFATEEEAAAAYDRAAKGAFKSFSKTNAQLTSIQNGASLTPSPSQASTPT